MTKQVQVKAQFTPQRTASDEAVAEMALDPVNAATGVIGVWSAFAYPGLNLDAVSHALRKSIASDDHLKLSSDMLIAQANALQAMFVEMARRALKQESTSHYETHLRLALRAQNQCRATLETLAVVKNPTVVFARQANINNGGQQQVNNHGAPGPTGNACGQKTPILQSKLLETSDGERMDSGAKGAPGRADTGMAAMGEVDRAAVSYRQSRGRQEQLEGRDAGGTTRAVKGASSATGRTRNKRAP